jgi:hypothetical protein
MISFLRAGGSRWYERGIMPYGELEFLLPSGDYSLRIYDKNNVTLYSNTTVHMVNSKLYVLNGSHLELVINGQSIIIGQLLELNLLLHPTVVEVGYNIPFIRSIYDAEWNIDGLDLIGGNISLICPPQILMATTHNRTWSNRTLFPLIPANGTALNGTITVPSTDRIWFQGGAATWVNVSYSNGTLIQNTTYVPNFVDVYGHPAVNITSDINVSLDRETRFYQTKQFYWTKYSDLNKYQATVNFTNVLGEPYYEVDLFIASLATVKLQTSETSKSMMS